MSLINDAIKRAKDGQPPAANQPVETKAPLQPAATPPGQSTTATGAVYVSVALFAVVLGCWLLAKGWDGSQRAALTSGTTVAAREAAPATTTLPPEIFPPAPVASTAAVEPVRDFSIAEAAPTPVEPQFKLQGIFFRTTNPSAVINGKTVFIGSRVQNARVTAIRRDSVTIENEGATQVLTLD